MTRAHARNENVAERKKKKKKKQREERKIVNWPTTWTKRNGLFDCEHCGKAGRNTCDFVAVCEPG